AAFALLAPVAACGLLLAAYNFVRFGSWTEVGTRYMLLGGPPVLWLDPRAWLPNLYFHFLAPLRTLPRFPFLFLESRYPGALPPLYFGEPIAGLLVHSPFLLILAAAPWPLAGAGTPSRLLRARVVGLAAVGLAGPLLTSL